MNDLVVVSNRGPATLKLAEDGSLEVHHAAGGLAPSLLRALEGIDAANALWVASAMSEGDRRAAREGLPAELVGGTGLRLVDVPRELSDAAYRVIANGTLWYLAHGLFDHARRPVLDRHWHEAFEGYRQFNRLFADEVAEHAGEGATVVVNDYHLFLVGSRLAELRPDLRTVHFTHTPFPTAEELRLLPASAACELLAGLASHGACGFHTDRWGQAFITAAAGALEGTPVVFRAPLGTDVTALEQVAASPECVAAGRRLEDQLDGRRLIFRADRIEPSKNLLRGLLAYEELLERAPRFRERVVFVSRAYPSRQDLPDYLAYGNEVERLTERVNERFGTARHQPVVLETEDDFPASVAALARYDVLLVNPVRDGMNLVAKEGPALNRNDGVLALSREAGAHEELAGPALEVHPYDVSATASVLAEALDLPADERRARAEELRRRAPGLSPARWFSEVRSQARRAAPLPLRPPSAPVW